MPKVYNDTFSICSGLLAPFSFFVPHLRLTCKKRRSVAISTPNAELLMKLEETPGTTGHLFEMAGFAGLSPVLV